MELAPVERGNSGGFRRSYKKSAAFTEYLADIFKRRSFFGISPEISGILQPFSEYLWRYPEKGSPKRNIPVDGGKRPGKIASSPWMKPFMEANCHDLWRYRKKWSSFGNIPGYFQKGSPFCVCPRRYRKKRKVFRDISGDIPFRGAKIPGSTWISEKTEPK